MKLQKAMNEMEICADQMKTKIQHHLNISEQNPSKQTAKANTELNEPAKANTKRNQIRLVTDCSIEDVQPPRKLARNIKISKDTEIESPTASKLNENAVESNLTNDTIQSVSRQYILRSTNAHTEQQSTKPKSKQSVNVLIPILVDLSIVCVQLQQKQIDNTVAPEEITASSKEKSLKSPISARTRKRIALSKQNNRK